MTKKPVDYRLVLFLALALVIVVSLVNFLFILKKPWKSSKERQLAKAARVLRKFRAREADNPPPVSKKRVLLEDVRPITGLTLSREHSAEYVIANLHQAFGAEIDQEQFDLIAGLIQVNGTADRLATLNYLVNEFKTTVFPDVPPQIVFEAATAFLENGNPIVIILHLDDRIYFVILKGYTEGPDGEIESWEVEDLGPLRGTMAHKDVWPIWQTAAGKYSMIVIHGEEKQAIVTRQSESLLCADFSGYQIPQAEPAPEASQSKIEYEPEWNPIKTSEKNGAEGRPNFGKTVELQLFQPIVVPTAYKRSCANYVAANLLSSLGREISKKYYDQISFQINPDQKGVSSRKLKSFLNKHFDCHSESFPNDPERGFEKLCKHLDSGNPAVLSVQVDSDLHSVILKGFSKHFDGTFATWSIEDNGLVRGTHSHRDFKTLWQCPDFPNVSNRVIWVSPITSLSIDSDVVSKKEKARKDAQKHQTPNRITVSKSSGQNNGGQANSNADTSEVRRVIDSNSNGKSGNQAELKPIVEERKWPGHWALLDQPIPSNVTLEDHSKTTFTCLSEDEFAEHLKRLREQYLRAPSRRTFIAPLPGLSEEMNELAIRMADGSLSHEKVQLLQWRYLQLEDAADVEQDRSHLDAFVERTRPFLSNFTQLIELPDLNQESVQTLVYGISIVVVVLPLLFWGLYRLTGSI